MTKSDITKAIQELQEAMYQTLEADKELEDAHLKKQAAHKRLTLAKDEIRGLTWLVS